MNKRILLLLGALVLFSSHDMFLKLDTYFLPPQTPVEIQLFNGTFAKSENVITRDRMLDVSLVGRGEKVSVDKSDWTERDSITILKLRTGNPGTWVAGVSTGPRNIEMAAEDFNDYLEHDGILDMLSWRKENDAMNLPAVEKYSKHVKVIFQVGDSTTGDWSTEFGYPIEFIPLENPYDLHPGHTLPVKLLFGGKPLTNQLVYVGYDSGSAVQGHTHDGASDHDHAAGDTAEHSHDTQTDHSHTEGTRLRTNDEGIAEVFIPAKGTWFLRTIHLVPSEEPGLTHESNWATLTFAVGDGHSHEHRASGENAAPDKEEALLSDSQEGLPSFIYGFLAAIAVFGVFYLIKRSRKRN